MTERLSYDGCVVCGKSAVNPRSLCVAFAWDTDARRVSAVFSPDWTWCGFEETVHGGLLAALLDDAMAWAVKSESGRFGVTGTLSLRYHRPVTSGGSYEVRGRVRESNGRRAKTEGEILDAEGKICVSAEALFVIPAPNAGQSKGV